MAHFEGLLLIVIDFPQPNRFSSAQKIFEFSMSNVWNEHEIMCADLSFYFRCNCVTISESKRYGIKTSQKSKKMQNTQNEKGNHKRFSSRHGSASSEAVPVTQIENTNPLLMLRLMQEFIAECSRK
jgi:hypothetical protein